MASQLATRPGDDGTFRVREKLCAYHAPGTVSNHQRNVNLNDEYERFVRARDRAVRSFLYRRVRNSEMAAEIHGDVFATAYRSFDTVSAYSDDQARRWLVGVAKNSCLHAFRVEARHHRVAAAVRDTVDPQIPTFDDDCDNAEHRPELVEQVHIILATIPPRHRRIIELNALEQMNGPEIARTLGISQTAVRLRLMRARRAFANAYLARFGDPFSHHDH